MPGSMMDLRDRKDKKRLSNENSNSSGIITNHGNRVLDITKAQSLYGSWFKIDPLHVEYLEDPYYLGDFIIRRYD
jgi:hypothetical protein